MMPRIGLVVYRGVVGDWTVDALIQKRIGDEQCVLIWTTGLRYHSSTPWFMDPDGNSPIAPIGTTFRAGLIVNNPRQRAIEKMEYITY